MLYGDITCIVEEGVCPRVGDWVLVIACQDYSMSNRHCMKQKNFLDRGFPLDVIGLEPGWQSKSYPCTFSWDKGRFPDPFNL